MLIIYNIEDKKDDQVVVEIHDHLLKKGEHQKAEVFRAMASESKRKRYELLDWVASLEEVKFQSNSSKCVYCDGELSGTEGMFCMNHCEELERVDYIYEKRA